MNGQRTQLMRGGEVYDDDEDIKEDIVDTLASEAGLDLLEFCVDYLEAEAPEDMLLDEDELQVSCPF
jgi:hypothetical protein